MARFVREVPSEVAQQMLVNKTVNAAQLLEARDTEAPQVDLTELEALARQVPAPELMPWEYAYVDLYTDGQRFYVALDEAFYRKSSMKTINPR